MFKYLLIYLSFCSSISFIHLSLFPFFYKKKILVPRQKVAFVYNQNLKNDYKSMNKIRPKTTRTCCGLKFEFWILRICFEIPSRGTSGQLRVTFCEDLCFLQREYQKGKTLVWKYCLSLNENESLPLLIVFHSTWSNNAVSFVYPFIYLSTRLCIYLYIYPSIIFLTLSNTCTGV